MKTHLYSLEGAPLRVQVHSKAERELEKRARELLLDRTVKAVYLMSETLEIHLDDGGVFSMACSGGFKEVD